MWTVAREEYTIRASYLLDDAIKAAKDDSFNEGVVCVVKDIDGQIAGRAVWGKWFPQEVAA